VAARDEEPPRRAGACRDWSGHVIVCGLNEVGLRTVEQLHLAGARVVVLDDDAEGRLARVVRGWGVAHLPRGAHLSEPLFDAGIAGARAVVCAEATDLRTLETILLIRDLRPGIPVVADLDNAAVAHAVEQGLDAVGVLDVAGLFAPEVVETVLGRRSRAIGLGDTQFVAAEVGVPHGGTLRELYGSLAPIGIVTGSDGELIACPGRDQKVDERDRVTLMGTPEQLREAGLPLPRGPVARRGRLAEARAALVRARSTASAIADRPLRVTLALGLALLVVSALVLHFGYRRPHGNPHLPFLDDIYFTVETVATVGFGDFSFSHQPAWVEAFGIFLIVAGTTLVTTVFALLTNALVSRRISQSLGGGRIPGMRHHIVLVGLGSVGMRVLEGLLAQGAQVVVVERLESSPYLARARSLGVPVVLGDATLGQTLESVNLQSAAGVAVVTSDDLTNIETGLAVRDRLGDRWGETPVVLRVFDRQLGRRVAESFGFRHVWSTSAIAAPWFVGAALGMEVLFTFYVGNHAFLLARLRVSAGGGLDGLAMRELPGQIRVVAIRRAESPERLEHPPRRDTRLAPGDDAFLAGPYGELLEVLRHDRSSGAGPDPIEPGESESAPPGA
jgi:Trk K+ transport system NAD-binding subunit